MSTTSVKGTLAASGQARVDDQRIQVLLAGKACPRDLDRVWNFYRGGVAKFVLENQIICWCYDLFDRLFAGSMTTKSQMVLIRDKVFKLFVLAR